MTIIPTLAEQYGPYDERVMLARTVLNYQGSLLTAFEKDVHRAFFARAKAAAYQNSEIEVRTRAQPLTSDSTLVDETVSQGFNNFLLRLAERVQQECLAEVHLNRCPSCNKIAIAPMARWCIWCKHDWHPPKTAAADSSNPKGDA